jgi:hypothetical protein
MSTQLHRRKSMIVRTLSSLLVALFLTSFSTAQNQHAFLWTATGGMQDLGVPNNVGAVKHYVRTHSHALLEERHFALVVGFALSNLGSLLHSLLAMVVANVLVSDCLGVRLLGESLCSLIQEVNADAST